MLDLDYLSSADLPHVQGSMNKVHKYAEMDTERIQQPKQLFDIEKKKNRFRGYGLMLQICMRGHNSR